MLTVATLGLRDLYGKREIHGIADIKGVKVRVQATPTEDRMFPAYGAQVVHTPFGDVYTALQTGVVDMAENGINVYLSNKHYGRTSSSGSPAHGAGIGRLLQSTGGDAIYLPLGADVLRDIC